MLGYMTEQGLGWMKVQYSARTNEDFLADPKISEEMKRKVLLVGEYKKFFYHYFGKEPTGIYSKTTMLSTKAVSYLVIASEHNKIEAKEHEFPFLGSFPYLGFYKKESARDFAQKLNQEQNLVTYIRPVYAYSTLGYFEDRILSSFFHYDDVELAELVFHELFHTIFFIKDEVDLNENMANLYGKELIMEYFKNRPELHDYMELEKKKIQVSKRIVELIGILQDEFNKLGGFLTDDKADELTQRFVAEVLRPDIRGLCERISLPDDECELKEEWNQAAFAAFLTYEEEQDFLQKLKDYHKLDLREFLNWLKSEYKNLKQQKKFDSFTDFLKSKVPHETASPH
jgi:predicted aminopeptidase